MIMTMKMGRRTQSRRAGSRKRDCVEAVMAVMVSGQGSATRLPPHEIHLTRGRTITDFILHT
jgi:hypothetical protein